MDFSNYWSIRTKLHLSVLCVLMALSTGCDARPPGDSFPDLAGPWSVHLNSHDLGMVRTVLSVEVDGNGFSAHTRKGASRDILGVWKSTLAKIFTDDFKGDP